MKVNFNKTGQINLDSEMGKFVYEFIIDNKINRILETGTWNGQGSTRILYEAMKDLSNPSIISFETNKQHFNMAKELYSSTDWISIINGSIVKSDEFEKTNLTGTEPDWLSQDIEQYKNCKLYDIEDYNFQLAFLDSSEFCGFSEFKKIENKCKFVVLDDTRTRKHVKTREYCLDKHECIVDRLEDRNGWAVFEMEEISKNVTR